MRDTIRMILVVCGSISSLICLLSVIISVFSPQILDNNSTIIHHESLNCSKAQVWNRKLNNIRKTYSSSLWGSYSPGIYFGLKTATPIHSLSTGIMWTKDIKFGPFSLRHNTAQDELDSFDWIIHDGKNYGFERLVDSKLGLSIDATFVVPGQSKDAHIYSNASSTWMQHFRLTPHDGSSHSFFVYFGVECIDNNQRIQCLSDSALTNLRVIFNKSRPSALNVYGHSKTSGWFCLSVVASGDESPSFSFSGLSNLDTSGGVMRISRDLQQFQQTNIPPSPSRVSNSVFPSGGEGSLHDLIEEGSTFIALRAALSSSAEVIVSLFEHLPDVSSGEDLDVLISRREAESNEMREERTAQMRKDFVTWNHSYVEAFQRRFKSVFPLIGDVSSHSFSALEEQTAQRALSAMLGGIGFFHGSPRIGDALDVNQDQSESLRSVSTVASPSALSLLTGTPSRTVFPRGFLWDEGFHQLLISRWDAALSMQTLSDWLQTMHFADESEGCHSGGWIPREMILGAEAQRRVPEEFVTQRVNVANPPTLLLVVDGMLDRLPDGALPECSGVVDSCPATLEDPVILFLTDAYPLLHDWVQWYLQSQQGSQAFPGSFRWRGRSLSDQKVVPNTLSSGLDDYPRSALPSPDEHHVDLHCWMVTAVGVMTKLGEALLRRVPNGTDLNLIQHHTQTYREQHAYLLTRLDTLHWSEEHAGYFDVGLNSENSTFSVEIFFKCVVPSDQSSSVEISVPLDIARSGATDFCPASHPQALYPLGDGNGGYKHKEVYTMDASSVRLQHIPRVGYVSIFPLLLKHIAPGDSRKLSAVLDMLESPEQLWTEYGLRSMSKSDKFYNKRNSPGDAPYWRGPIWININYLALSALHHYARNEQCSLEVRSRVDALYLRLRENVQRTVLGEYERTGYFWEHYEDVQGRGIRGHPFSGWTALVLNIMTEKY